jgi:hypothetical protein
VRSLVRFRWLLPVIVIPACVVVAGVGVQAAAFGRPPRDSLVAASALRGMMRYRVMRGTERIGRRQMSSVCVQGWFRAPRHQRFVRRALVLLGSGERLYEAGREIRRFGTVGAVSPLDIARFELAGCPRFVGNSLGTDLVRGFAVDADPMITDGASTVSIVFGRKRRIALAVDGRTGRLVALRYTSRLASGWSDLEPGGDKAQIARVRRAFGLLTARTVVHA